MRIRPLLQGKAAHLILFGALCIAPLESRAVSLRACLRASLGRIANASDSQRRFDGRQATKELLDRYFESGQREPTPLTSMEKADLLARYFQIRQYPDFLKLPTETKLKYLNEVFRSISRIPRPLREMITEGGGRLDLVTDHAGNHPDTEHLKSERPPKYPVGKTYQDCYGLCLNGVSIIPANRLHLTGSTDVVLHEHGHSLDLAFAKLTSDNPYMTAPRASSRDGWLRARREGIWDRSYYDLNADEDFAESFAWYYKSAESRSEFQKRFPKRFEFLAALEAEIRNRRVQFAPPDQSQLTLSTLPDQLGALYNGGQITEAFRQDAEAFKPVDPESLAPGANWTVLHVLKDHLLVPIGGRTDLQIGRIVRSDPSSVTIFSNSQSGELVTISRKDIAAAFVEEKPGSAEHFAEAVKTTPFRRLWYSGLEGPLKFLSYYDGKPVRVGTEVDLALYYGSKYGENDGYGWGSRAQGFVLANSNGKLELISKSGSHQVIELRSVRKIDLSSVHPSTDGVWKESVLPSSSFSSMGSSTGSSMGSSMGSGMGSGMDNGGVNGKTLAFEYVTPDKETRWVSGKVRVLANGNLWEVTDSFGRDLIVEPHLKSLGKKELPGVKRMLEIEGVQDAAPLAIEIRDPATLYDWKKAYQKAGLNSPARIRKLDLPQRLRRSDWSAEAWATWVARIEEAKARIFSQDGILITDDSFRGFTLAKDSSPGAKPTYSVIEPDGKVRESKQKPSDFHSFVLQPYVHNAHIASPRFGNVPAISLVLESTSEIPTRGAKK